MLPYSKALLRPTTMVVELTTLVVLVIIVLAGLFVVDLSSFGALAALFQTSSRG